MHHADHSHSDFGTGQKSLSIYLIGTGLCILLTLISFWVVMTGKLDALTSFSIIYLSAIIQLFVQIVCFLRLNTQTEQGKLNVMSLLFTGVIIMSIVVGSLWIMWNLHYYMM